METMTDNKTPKEDFERFEKFIDAMEDMEFNYWYAYEATSSQKNLANQIREEVTEEEANGVFP